MDALFAVAETVCRAFGRACPFGGKSCRSHVKAGECQSSVEARAFLTGMEVRYKPGDLVRHEDGRVGMVENSFEVSNFGILPPYQRLVVGMEDGYVLSAASFKFKDLPV